MKEGRSVPGQEIEQNVTPEKDVDRGLEGRDATSRLLSYWLDVPVQDIRSVGTFQYKYSAGVRIFQYNTFGQ